MRGGQGECMRAAQGAQSRQVVGLLSAVRWFANSGRRGRLPYGTRETGIAGPQGRTLVRKVVAHLFISLDGVVEAPDQWHFPYFNDEMGAAVGASLMTDTLLLGRVTYDSFAGAWPDRETAGEADAEFAKVLGDPRKIVVSRQPLSLTWRNLELLQGDLLSAVAALKDEPG